MAFYLPKVYPLTDVGLTGLSHAEQVGRLAAGGASIIQIRDKTSSSQELYDQARLALKTARELGVLLIINDRVDIALAIGADGVHLGQDDLPPNVVRKLLGNKAIIGYSTHNITQALEARDLPLDYLAIGPIFSTTTKADTAPVLGLEGLRTVRQALNSPPPLVAIGGINTQNALEVLEAGADSVAMIGGLLSKPHEITLRTSLLLAALNSI